MSQAVSLELPERSSARILTSPRVTVSPRDRLSHRARNGHAHGSYEVVSAFIPITTALPAGDAVRYRWDLAFDNDLQQCRGRALVAEADLTARGLVPAGPPGDGDGARVVWRLFDAVRGDLPLFQHQGHVEQQLTARGCLSGHDSEMANPCGAPVDQDPVLDGKG
jgi:hypothetical protein